MYLLDIAQTGVAAILLHPLRSLATAGALVVVLTPFLVGLGLSKGVQAEAEASIHFGADLYVTATQFGQRAPIPLKAVEDIKRLDGVEEATPRIVGAIVLGKNRENAVVVGLPPERFPKETVRCVHGRLPRPGPAPELVFGTELARRLGLGVGDPIRPFYRNDKGDKVSQVVGIFEADVSLWQSNLILTTFDAAAAIFNQSGLATDVLVKCRPGYESRVSAAIQQNLTLEAPGGEKTLRPQVTSRADLQDLLPSGLLHREGIFTLLFLLAFAVGILAVLVTSGFGLSERRREIGILKATGWQTDEILLRSGVESALLSLAAAATAILLAYLWLKGFNGYGIVGIFIAGVDLSPGFRVPFRLTPVPVLLAFVISLAVILTGTLYSSWRAATVSPREAMR